jgi:hypothetical protein
VPGPGFLVLDRLRRRIRLARRTGFAGKGKHKAPYLMIASDLATGTPLHVLVQFTSPTGQRPGFRLRIVTGQLPQ